MKSDLIVDVSIYKAKICISSLAVEYLKKREDKGKKKKKKDKRKKKKKRKRRAKDGFKVMDLNNWKNRVAIYLDGEDWERQILDEDQELSLASLLFKMPFRHPRGDVKMIMPYESEVQYLVEGIWTED